MNSFVASSETIIKLAIWTNTVYSLFTKENELVVKNN